MATESYRILHVEDNPGDVRLVQEAFKTIDTETVLHTVTDGEEAIEFFRKQATQRDSLWPDLTLLDLNLPRASGMEVLETIRGEEPFRHVPVIILSSSTAREDVERSYEEHANAYLGKPTDSAEYMQLANAIEQFWLETAQLPSIRS